MRTRFPPRHDGSPQPDKGNGANFVCYSIQGNTIDRDAKQNGLGISENIAHTLDAVDRHAVGPIPQDGAEPGMKQQTYVFDARGNGDGNVCCTLTGDHQDRVTDYTAICVGNGQLHQISMAETANTLDAMHDQQAVYVEEVAHCLLAQGNKKNRPDLETYPVQNSVVRRLTPLECERLQGYPDGWTNLGEWTDSKGKRRRDADSTRYRALGNSIALPFWQWLARRIAAQYVGTPTLGSLFDGIGGFPLVWTRATGSAKNVRWSSEIEEFPLAVLRRRFGDESAGTDGDWREFL